MELLEAAAAIIVVAVMVRAARGAERSGWKWGGLTALLVVGSLVVLPWPGFREAAAGFAAFMMLSLHQATHR